MMKKYLLLLLGAALWSSSCKKTRWSSMDDLPPITDTGANTFGCMVNGKLFRNKKVKGSWTSSLQCRYEFVAGRQLFTLVAENGDLRKAIIFNMEGFKLNGDTVFTYTSYAKSAPGISARYGTLGRTEYSTYDYCAGEFHLTHFAEAKSFAAGTFWFDAVDTLTRDTVRVRDGRFDIGY